MDNVKQDPVEIMRNYLDYLDRLYKRKGPRGRLVLNEAQHNRYAEALRDYIKANESKEV